MTGRRVGACVALAVVVVLACSVAISPSWGAATASAQSAGTAPQLILAGQSPWTPINGTFTMQLDGVNLPAGTTVVVTVHDALQSRTAFDQSVSGGGLPSARELLRFPFDTLPTDATGARVLSLPTLGLNEGGVYPIEVDLRDAADNSISHFVTHVVLEDLAPDGSLAVGVPLNVAWVWPLSADPAYVPLPDGRPDSKVLDELQPTGRLGRQATQIGANTDVPLTLAPSAETLDAWSTLSTKFPTLAPGITAVRAASPRDEILTGPFVPLDLPSILVSGLGGIINDEIGRGINTLEQVFNTHLDSSTALPGPLDPVSLRLLQSANVRQLVVDGDALTPVVEKYTPAHPYTMEAVPGDASTSVSVVATDPGFEKFLTGDDPPALRAAHLLAGLALVSSEQPSIARGITIVNPDRWDANDEFVQSTLAGLRGNPLIKPTTVAGLLASVPVATVDGTTDGAPVLRQLAPYQAPAAPVSVARYQQAQGDEAAVVSLVGATDPRALNGDRAIAASVSSALANPAGRVRAKAILNGVGNAASGFLDQVQIQHSGTITITSSSAAIPIGFRNTSNQPITVHVKLESDRLLFPDGAERDVTLPPNQSTTVRIAVETRSPGTSPLIMTVTTPGGLPIGRGPTRITVRSSFVSGVGIFLTVGAIAVLALWWGWDIHRRRKRRGHEPTRPRSIKVATGQPA